MSVVQENVSILEGAQVFRRLDASAGYWQVPLATESREVASFKTLLRRFLSKRLPFGVVTASEFFQCETLRILEGAQGQVCHKDHDLGFSKQRQEHDGSIREVLRRSQTAGVTLNAKKCVFAKDTLKFLAAAASHGSTKTRKVESIPSPRNVAKLSSFPGMVNHLANFLPHIAAKTKPVRDPQGRMLVPG